MYNGMDIFNVILQNRTLKSLKMANSSTWYYDHFSPFFQQFRTVLNESPELIKLIIAYITIDHANFWVEFLKNDWKLIDVKMAIWNCRELYKTTFIKNEISK